jgi:RNA polymerase sigma factor (sigma-70 family)
MSGQVNNENLLWESIRKGDKSALASLYDDFFQILYEYGMRFCMNRELVEDVIQELFIRLWEKRKTLIISGSVRSYLLVSVRNSVFNAVKKEDKYAFADEPFFLVNYEFDKNNFHEDLEESQVQALLEGLNKLTGRQKEILYLKFFQGLSQEEIANIMGITVKASYKLSSRALVSLKNLMGVSVPFLVEVLQYWKRI